MAKALTAKEQRFVDHIISDPKRNGTQAAIRAGYSPKSARSIASENLTKPHIQAAIRDAEEAQKRRTWDIQDGLVYELSCLAHSNILDFVAWDGKKASLIPSQYLTPEASRAIKKIQIEHDQYGRPQVKLELHDKVKPAELLGRHKGMFVERVEHGLDSETVRMLADVMGQVDGQSRGLPSEDGTHAD